MAGTIEPVKVYDASYKLILIGDSSVGKTSIIYRYVDNVFSANLLHTIGIDLQAKTIDIDGQKIKLQIWDTAGQELYSSRTVTSNFYRGAKGIMFVYDVTNQRSYDHICRWEETIRAYMDGASVQRILVGNKSDHDGSKRSVSTEDGQRLAASMNVPFVETSAKTGANVRESFDMLARMILTGSTSGSVPQFETHDPSAPVDTGRTCRC